MTFRSRTALVAALAVALAVAAASLVTYVVARDTLRGQVDDALRDRASGAELGSQAGGFIVRLPVSPFASASPRIRLVATGPNAPPTPPSALGVSERDRAVARGEAPSYFADETAAGSRVRVYTTQIAPGLALRLARSVEETEAALARLGLLLLLVGSVGIALAAALGLAVARAALAPVRRLTAAAERVTQTRDLSERIEATGSDELARLATSFNTMLGALARSVGAQRQLVADASHELRTPLTSARTNVELVASGVSITSAERQRMLRDSVIQLDELSTLVSDVVELARNGEQDVAREEVRLDNVVRDAVERVGRRHPHLRFELELEPSVVRAAPPRLARAVANLLENAVAWSPAGEPVSVVVRQGEVVVRDRGPGIAADDLPHVFDRFYRSPAARGLPGSGLGLAIVRQVADANGGRAWIELPAGGGTAVHLAFSPNT
jgi:two-component system sensor histidine kinase MprB